MRNIRFVMLFTMLVVCTAGLYSRMPIEVFVYKPNVVSQAILEAVQERIRQDSRFSLEDDYASSDRELMELDNETFQFIEEDLENFDFLLLMNARDVSTNNTSQVIIALDMVVQGVLFDTDIFLATDLSFSQIADRIYRKLGSYTGIFSQYQNQAMNSNRQAVASDLNCYMAEVIQYWKTPIVQGGAGQEVTRLTPNLISQFLGFNSRNTQITENGTFTILSVSNYTVKILGTMNVANDQGVSGSLTGIVDCRAGTAKIENN